MGGGGGGGRCESRHMAGQVQREQIPCLHLVIGIQAFDDVQQTLTSKLCSVCCSSESQIGIVSVFYSENEFPVHSRTYTGFCQCSTNTYFETVQSVGIRAANLRSQ